MKSYAEQFESLVFSPRNSDPEWLSGMRERSCERFRAVGFPTRKWEGWKYIPLEFVLKKEFEPIAGEDSGGAEDDLTPFLLSKETSARLVFINGKPSEGHSEKRDLPKGVILENLPKAIREHEDLLKKFWADATPEDANGFAAVNTYSFSDGVFFYVPRGTVMEMPVQLLFASTPGPSAPVFYPRLLLVLEEGAEVSIVFDSVSIRKAASLMNAVADIVIGKKAKLRWVQVQRKQPYDFELLMTRCRLAEDSTFDAVSFASGGALTRSETHLDLDGDRSACSMRDLSVLDGASQIFGHATVRHRARDCRSRQLTKNILAGSARSEFNSLVHVVEGVRGSNSNQLNRNLLMSADARAYSRPQLKIDADEVQATHGSATGQLEPGEIFYLRSRGLSEHAARLALMRGFAGEVVENVEPASLKVNLLDSVDRILQGFVEKAVN
ncbi:MAG: Fe-S cluster assembly protein SufD [Candidatus Omnitrophota bacterium]|nr:Fe-S cluster assembly protein SufD [Candidatus Omnitrophota bacterium]